MRGYAELYHGIAKLEGRMSVMLANHVRLSSRVNGIYGLLNADNANLHRQLDSAFKRIRVLELKLTDQCSECGQEVKNA